MTLAITPITVADATFSAAGTTAWNQGMQATMGANALLGNNTGAGAVLELTAAQAKALLAIAAGDVSGLAASATTDTTNASNISSGTLNSARLPTVPVGSGGTNATSARAAASNLALAYILGKSSVGVSCGVDTTEDTLATVSIPSGAMGPNGFLLLYMKWTFTNSANSKTLRARIDGASGTAFFSRAFTTISSYDLVMKIANVNSNSVQLASGHGNDSGTNGRIEANVSGAVNTASGSATSLVITGQKGLNSETLTLDSYLCLLCSDGT